jgi:antitoxin component YwqK of YwqJK toxin-antitoxin module
LNGKLEGPSVEYNEDGTKKQEGNYKDNNEDGEWKIYEQGKPARKIYYRKGKLIKIIAIK